MSLQHLLRTYLISEANKNPTFTFSPTNSHLWHFEIKNRVLSLYYNASSAFNSHESPKYPVSSKKLFFNQCDERKTLYGFGNRNTWWHDAWHSTNEEKEQSHYHIIKGKYEDITPEDLKCLIGQIREFQKQNASCVDGKTDCMLSTASQAKLTSRYTKFHDQFFDQLSYSIYEHFNDIANVTLKGILHSLTATMLQNYIKPLLINKGYSLSKISWAETLILTSMSTFLNSFTSSYLGLAFKTALSIICHSVISIFEPYLGDDTHIFRDNLLSGLHSALSVVNDPLSLLEIGAAGTGAALGKYLAFKMISSMPKLKIEEAPPVDEEYSPEVNTGQSSGTLRRRHTTSSGM